MLCRQVGNPIVRRLAARCEFPALNRDKDKRRHLAILQTLREQVNKRESTRQRPLKASLSKV